GQRLADYAAFARYVNARPDTEILVTYRRDGAIRSLRVRTVAEEVNGVVVGRLRAEPQRARWPESMQIRRDYTLFGALPVALAESWKLTVIQAQLFWRMLTGSVSVKNLSGPLSIAEFAGESARGGIGPFLSMLVLISLSLGFLNLLPIPILDGGQILYQLAEWIKGSPLSERTQALGQQVGIALLVLLMGVAFFNDIVRQFQVG
ncbi:MAG: site-2 protease family protein, partial [Steroidobacteraceae bacterium]|nr:site-2 protease family protein [Steroidobacteraceae bacterium]